VQADPRTGGRDAGGREGARRVTFVHTQNRRFAETQTFGIQLMPVWAYTLAAHLADLPGIEMRLFDGRLERLRSIQPADLFLFTGINQDYDAIVAAQRYVKTRFPDARTVIGGPICWSFRMADQIDALTMFDHIVVGDGEDIIRPLVAGVLRGEPLPQLIETSRRFDLARALPLHRPLLEQTIQRYYGAVLEVSRGCPFLCEFCDIRILPDNNRAHVKSPDLIVSELDALYDMGARQVLFACDNFIGDVRWAQDVCERIIRWQERSRKRVSLYTWLTVNVARHSELLRALRGAGFDLLFIGVESFSRPPLVEAAKVQNAVHDLAPALRTIQSYGFVVLAGLIFGFDTDPDDVVDVTLRGLQDACLISGDPSLLAALPGTPLYHRMALSGRLRAGKLGLGGFKYQTNMRYTKSAARIRLDFRTFVRELNRPRYQYRRLLAFYDCIQSANYVPPRTGGYADLRRLASMAVRDRRALRLLGARLLRLLGSPERLGYIVRALVVTLARSRRARPLWFYFKFWLFSWSNTIMKYGALTDADFDVEGVGEDFGAPDVLPTGYEDSCPEPIPTSKIRAQRRLTAAALRQLVLARGAGQVPPSKTEVASDTPEHPCAHRPPDQDGRVAQNQRQESVARQTVGGAAANAVCEAANGSRSALDSAANRGGR
jgi:radical SAM superfamily enzyme YgiQ (UPF0313 family)